jgi:hypothetical protein
MVANQCFELVQCQERTRAVDDLDLLQPFDETTQRIFLRLPGRSGAQLEPKAIHDAGRRKRFVFRPAGFAGNGDGIYRAIAVAQRKV